MISAKTPPGTKIVSLVSGGCAHMTIAEGAVYTVAEMALAVDGDVIVCLEELDHSKPVRMLSGATFIGWTRDCFRYAALPSCLTDVLTAAPVDVPEPVGL